MSRDLFDREIVIEEVADEANKHKMVPRRRVRNGRILDWYRDRHYLDRDHHENFNLWWAGNMLSHQLEELNAHPKLISMYEEWIGKGSIEGFFTKRGDVGKEVDAALDYVGNTGRGVVISVCWLDEPVGNDRLPILREALRHLFRFYDARKTGVLTGRT